MYLKEFREKIGLTQKELSEKIDLAQSAVARLEKVNSNPTRVILQKYIDNLNANINYLFTGEGPILKTDISQLNVENINITNDLLLFNSQEELNEKFNNLLVESIVSKFEKSDTTFVKLFNIFKRYNPLKIRPILFMYYIFQNIEKDLINHEDKSISNEKQYLIEMIQKYKVFNIVNQPLFTKRIKKEISEYINNNFSEFECEVIINNYKKTLALLESKMPTIVVSAHKDLYK